MNRVPSLATTPPGGFSYTQPETGVKFQYGTWHEMVMYVGKHRKAMGLDISDGWADRLEHEMCVQSPHLGCFDDSVPATCDTPLAVAGRALWKELHAFAEQYPEAPTEDDKSNARYWMASWRDRIPRYGGCTCREDWARLEANLPPDYNSRQSFVKWATVGHDAINRKIGKPIFRPDWLEAANLGGF